MATVADLQLIIEQMGRDLAIYRRAIADLLGCSPPPEGHVPPNQQPADRLPAPSFWLMVPTALDLAAGVETPTGRGAVGLARFSFELSYAYWFTVPVGQDASVAIAGGSLRVVQALAESNQRVPVGTFQDGHCLYDLRAVGQVAANSTQQIRPPHAWEITIAGQATIDARLFVHPDNTISAYPYANTPVN